VARPGGLERQQGAVIVPDYARPAALMVPHYRGRARPFLEEIAVAAAEHVGVILLADDEAGTQAFVARQKRPERFSIIAGSYNTPWIRDRAPIALRRRGAVAWVLPRLPQSGRTADDELFTTITVRRSRPAPLLLAHGNLVAGPRGVALSSTRVLGENGLNSPADIAPFKGALGIRAWLVFEPFPDEPTAHADVHVRFLKPNLAAIAWHPEDRELQDRAVEIERLVGSHLPRARILRLPLRRSGDRYASLLNWVQIGRKLIAPRYRMTPDSDLAEASAALREEGFQVRFIAAPTLKWGGAIHCLTASIFT